MPTQVPLASCPLTSGIRAAGSVLRVLRQRRCRRRGFAAQQPGAGRRHSGHCAGPAEAWPPIHRLRLADVEDLLWDARMLQGRAEQPPLHALRQLHWRPTNREEHQAKRQRQQQHKQLLLPRHDDDDELAPDLDDPLSSYTNYGGADEERGLGLAQQPLAGTALTALLTQVSSGAGLGILQLSASPEHRALLSSHTPHELALVVVGLALSVGADPEQLEPRNFLHFQQRHQLQKNERWTLASSLRWPTEPPSQVTAVACIQDTIGTMGDVSSSERQPHVVWAASAVRLLEKVEQRDPVLAKLLLQPQYTPISDGGQTMEPAMRAAVLASIDREGHDEAVSRSWGRRKPVFSRSNGDGRVRSVLGGGGAQALRVDAADRDPAAQDYAAALRLLQVVERDLDPDGEVWQRLELRAGDIAVVDSTVVLRPTAPAGADSDSPGRHLQQRSPDAVAEYEEIDVLRACAQTRGGCEQQLGTTHALWLGLGMGSGLSPLNLAEWKETVFGGNFSI